MHVFAFDRDRTVDVNPPRRRRAVPLAWVRYLAHETEHEVWAIGNQQLTDEADIPGVAEAVDQHPDQDGFDRSAVHIPREDRVRLVGDLFPEAERHIVVDDVNLKHLDGWTHYFPWAFVEAVEGGDIDIDLPTAVLRQAEGQTLLSRLLPFQRWPPW